jgi:hypothetical protein
VLIKYCILKEEGKGERIGKRRGINEWQSKLKCNLLLKKEEKTHIV